MTWIHFKTDVNAEYTWTYNDNNVKRSNGVMMTQDTTNRFDKYAEIITKNSWLIPNYKCEYMHINDTKVLPENIIESDMYMNHCV